ncbi:MAG: hypothetical protein E7284_03655 [Lachnospiraceae bacterium]|nr:hypothetical protein [Lachnospiraceae bacterium]
MNDKNIRLSYFLLVYLGAAVLLVVAFKLSYTPGSFVLLFQFLKYLLLIFFCTLPISLVWLKKQKQKIENRKIEENQFMLRETDDVENADTLKESEEKKNPFEYTPPANTNKIDLNFGTVVVWIIGGALAVFLLFKVWDCVLDLIQGPEQIVLSDAAYLKETQTTGRNGRRRTRVHYFLEGLSIDGTVYAFEINGVEKSLATTINNQNPTIVCYMYPNTMSLVQVDIYTDEGVITLPKGKEPRENPKTGEKYTDTELDSAFKTEFKEFDFEKLFFEKVSEHTGKLLYEVMDDVAWCYDDEKEDGFYFYLKDENDDNYPLYKMNMDALDEELGLNSTQNRIIVFRGNVAMVVIYNINTERVENIRVFECSALSVE